MKQPKYEKGEKVKYMDNVFTVEGHTWNGFTYMYSFKETNMRCGEMYLESYKHSEIEIAKYDSLDKIVEQLESCEYQNEAGMLSMNVAFIALKRMLQSTTI